MSDDIENNKGSLAFPEEQAPAAANSGVPHNQRRKKILLAALAALALIGLVVGLSVGLTRKNDNDNDTTSQPSAFQFPQTKAFVDSVCSTQDDLSRCQETCQPVECCNPMSENNCLAENAEKCFEYAKCHVLEETTTRAAPANLTQVCLLQDDKTECVKACQEAKCCVDETNNCQDSQFLTCMDYAACQVLSKVATVEPAPEGLLETCMDPNGREECESECAKASCCWEQDGNCLATDMITCMTYAPCGSLLFQAPNSVVDRPDEDFQQACSIDSVLTPDGYEDCADLCGEADCCMAEGEENCFMQDPIGCMQYLQCGLLAFSGGQVEAADTQELQEKCDLQQILNNGTVSEECKTACEPAECCVSQGDDNCLADGNALACATYLPCLPVLLFGESGLGSIFSGGGLPDFGDGFPGFGGDSNGGGNFPLFGEGTLESPPDDLQDTCSIQNISTDEGRKECEAVCATADCCTSMDSDNCFLENIITCATWNLQGCLAVNGFQQT